MFGRTRDPVCGMKVQENVSTPTAEYEGKTYYFCSLSCKEQFMEHPEEYITGKEKSSKSMGSCCCHH